MKAKFRAGQKVHAGDGSIISLLSSTTYEGDPAWNDGRGNIHLESELRPIIALRDHPRCPKKMKPKFKVGDEVLLRMRIRHVREEGHVRILYYLESSDDGWILGFPVLESDIEACPRRAKNGEKR